MSKKFKNSPWLALLIIVLIGATFTAVLLLFLLSFENGSNVFKGWKF